ncbi:MAG TPA: hypothetical protein VFT27_12410 [Actinomycetota bacterium]|nr:hypothetical protein [Actinomycetota bacterium]
MIKRVSTVSTLALVLLVASVALAPAAAAVAPERSWAAFDDAFTDDQTCAFPIDVRFVGRLEITTFFDRHGDVVRVQMHGSDIGTATNPANGRTARGVDHYMVVERVKSGETATVGLFVHMNLPGAGIVLIDVGNVVVDADGNVVHTGGRHDLLTGNFGALCAALA